jgi:hypothetical protein
VGVRGFEMEPIFSSQLNIRRSVFGVHEEKHSKLESLQACENIQKHGHPDNQEWEPVLVL